MGRARGHRWTHSRPRSGACLLVVMLGAACAEEEILAPVARDCSSWAVNLARDGQELDVGARVALLDDVVLVAWPERPEGTADLGPSRLHAAHFERSSGEVVVGPQPVLGTQQVFDVAVALCSASQRPASTSGLASGSCGWRRWRSATDA